jgi:HK97 family phage portal protein
MAWFRKRTEDRALTKSDDQSALLGGGVVSMDGQGWPNWVGMPLTVTPASALQIADAYACIRALSDACASLPLIAYRRLGDGQRQRLMSGRLADLLKAPGPGTTQANLIGQLVCHLNTWGNAFVGKYRDDQGTVTQLGLLAPDRVQVELKRGEPLYTLSSPQGLTSEHGVEDILHIKAMGSDGLVGLSPIAQCRVALGLSQNLAYHASNFFINDARPGGLLVVDGDVGHDALRRLSDVWSTDHGGVRNAHRIAIVADPIRFEPVMLPMEDTQFLQQRELSATEIARIFRVPGWVVNAGTGDRSITYANVQQQAEHFVKFSLSPWLTLIEQAISGDPDLSPQSVFVEFLLDNLLRGDPATRAEVYTKALDPITGWMTREEVRRLENLSPEPVITSPPPVVAATNGASNA